MYTDEENKYTCINKDGLGTHVHIKVIQVYS